jgi:hypothetical protein
VVSLLVPQLGPLSSDTIDSATVLLVLAACVEVCLRRGSVNAVNDRWRTGLGALWPAQPCDGARVYRSASKHTRLTSVRVQAEVLGALQTAEGAAVALLAHGNAPALAWLAPSTVVVIAVSTARPHVRLAALQVLQSVHLAFSKERFAPQASTASRAAPRRTLTAAAWAVGRRSPPLPRGCCRCWRASISPWSTAARVGSKHTGRAAHTAIHPLRATAGRTFTRRATRWCPVRARALRALRCGLPPVRRHPTSSTSSPAGAHMHEVLQADAVRVHHRDCAGSSQHPGRRTCSGSARRGIGRPRPRARGA